MNSAAAGRTGGDREQESMMRKMTKKPPMEDGIPEGGIERIAARRLAPIEGEMARIRAYVEATRAW
jgi:hypothetical protein